ncbi:hypothetical protein FKP32DRAFT_1555870, partial [Trametes sanguinea]
MPGRAKSQAARAQNHHRLQDELLHKAVALYWQNGSLPNSQHVSLHETCFQSSSNHHQQTGQWIEL